MLGRRYMCLPFSFKRGLTKFPNSDGVLNPSGVRFGTSEIYAVVEKFADIIQDSLCAGRSIPGSDEEVILFVQTNPGIVFTKQTEKMLRDAISAALSSRHVPKRFYPVTKIPYNVNGKKLEIAVKRMISGATIDDKTRATLADPQDLDEFEHFAISEPARAKL
jgi:acetoacetyl-CoA synthetase